MQLISDFVEPVRWVTPTVLKIRKRHHDKIMDESGSSSESGHAYDVTATITADGKATIDSKLDEKGF